MPASGQKFFYYFAVNIGEPKFTTLIGKRQFLVVDSQQM
jgi:hypothetical protein